MRDHLIINGKTANNVHLRKNEESKPVVAAQAEGFKSELI